MHSTEALTGGLEAFEEAVQTRACPFLNELGNTALSDMHTVYEQIDAGDYSQVSKLAEQLAAAVKAQQPSEVAPSEPVPEKTVLTEAVNLPLPTIMQPETTLPDFANTHDVAPVANVAMQMHEMPERHEAANVPEAPVAVLHSPDILVPTIAPLPRDIVEGLLPAAETAQITPPESPGAYDAKTEVITAILDIEQTAPVQAAIFEQADSPVQVVPLVEQHISMPVVAEVAPMLTPLPEEARMQALELPEPAIEAIIDFDEMLPTIAAPVLSSEALPVPPAPVVTEFGLALQSLVHTDEQLPLATNHESEQPQPEDAPPIVIELADKLATAPIEVQYTVQNTIREILTELNHVQIESASDKEVAPVGIERLEAIVVQLLEELQLDCEPAELRQLLTVIFQLEPKVLLEVPELPLVDLTRQGTREAKRLMTMVSDDFKLAEHRLEQLIGKAAMLMHVSAPLAA